MFYSPDIPCPHCKECLFDVDETSLIYVCINCGTVQEFKNGTELTENYINYLTDMEDLEWD